MGPSPLKHIIALLLLISCVAIHGVSSIGLTSQNSETGHTEEGCPPCDLLFSKLGKAGRGIKLSQNVQVQERGEPKSGTRIMYCWATAALIRACNYLQEKFGKDMFALRYSFGTRTETMTNKNEVDGTIHAKPDWTDEAECVLTSASGKG